ncbi:MAG TPA: RNA polymerase sigma factor [Thermoanaerobaculia bacterium]|nr:RNA polymerase sigma factor [Thermoanaerobaculia bacterium]HUM29840.1 RNA polymerase sigma factor [Thermoanaerobaculia bacterium]HXK68115.1 RNA polymerase sigma factor [Thermoanaerobaculia bacterium]
MLYAFHIPDPPESQSTVFRSPEPESKSWNKIDAGAWVEETYTMVYSALIRLCGGDRETAEDLTQETYRKAWQGLSSYAGKAKLSTWLYQIAYHTFLNHIRKPARLISVKDYSAIPANEEHEPQGLLEKEDLQERLRMAVMGLPDDLRFSLTAHFWAEIPVREIARMEGLSSMAIRKRLKRALKLLEAFLGEAES